MYRLSIDGGEPGSTLIKDFGATPRPSPKSMEDFLDPECGRVMVVAVYGPDGGGDVFAVPTQESLSDAMDATSGRLCMWTEIDCRNAAELCPDPTLNKILGEAMSEGAMEKARRALRESLADLPVPDMGPAARALWDPESTATLSSLGVDELDSMEVVMSAENILGVQVDPEGSGTEVAEMPVQSLLACIASAVLSQRPFEREFDVVLRVTLAARVNRVLARTPEEAAAKAYRERSGEISGMVHMDFRPGDGEPWESPGGLVYLEAHTDEPLVSTVFCSGGYLGETWVDPERLDLPGLRGEGKAGS